MAEKDAADGTPPSDGVMKPRDPRAERLAAQLRANLRRRKDQARARSAGDGDADS